MVCIACCTIRMSAGAGARFVWRRSERELVLVLVVPGALVREGRFILEE
jgi:hypothetical protein